MGGTVSRGVVQAFYHAYAVRDPIRIAAYLADEVEWHMEGPVGIFPFCGYRRGKAAVVDFLARLKPSVFVTKRMDQEELVIDGNRAATFSRTTAVHNETGRVIVFHCAHFITFRDDKVVALYCVADTFDAAEQVMGHRIDAYHELDMTPSRDIVAI